MDRKNSGLRTFVRRPLAAAAVTLLAATALTVGVAELGGPEAAAAAQETFTCQGGAAQLYEVPALVTSVQVRVEGAAGGSGETNAGGQGGTVTATVAVEPGQSLGVVVGCADGAGYHWGGDGGPGSGTACPAASGAHGGGSSAVLTADFDEVVAEAGGGGGAGGGNTGCGVGGAGGRAGEPGGDGVGAAPAPGGAGGVTRSGHGHDGGQGRNPGTGGGAGGGGGGGGCLGGDGGMGGRLGNDPSGLASGGGGGGGSSCAGPLALRAEYGTASGGGRVTMSPDLLTMTNHASDVADENQNGRQDAGDVVDYSVTVLNDGALPVSDLTVTTTVRGVPVELACEPGRQLGPGATMTCATRYRLTTPDIAERAVAMESTADGRSASGDTLFAAASVEVQLNPAPALSLTNEQPVVDRNGNALTDTGDVIEYTVVVANAGGGTLTDVVAHGRLDDGELPLTCAGPLPATLPVGASLTCTAAHVITAADLAAPEGEISMVATAAGKTQNGAAIAAPQAPATTRLDRIAELTVSNTVTSVEDTNRNGAVDAGDVIDYAVAVTNTGTLTVADVAATQAGTAPATGIALDCAPATLAPADTLPCTGSYPLTQADVDHGTVTHTATATGRVDGGELRSDAFAATTPVPARTLVTATNTVSVDDTNDNELVDAGDELRYSVEVANDGTVTLREPTVDLRPGGVSGPTTVACPSGALRPGDTTACTGTYAITQAEVDAGTVEHTAVASATTPAGQRVDSPPSTAATRATRVAALVATNRVATVDDTNDNGRADAGDVLTYQVVATNTGTVTMAGVTVTETPVGGAGPVTLDCVPSTLAPGASVTCTGTYLVTQADVDDGEVTHTATATGTDPTGARTDTEPSTSTTKLSRVAALTVTNTVVVEHRDTDATTDVGDVLRYEVTVANAGTVTLTDVTATEAAGEVELDCAEEPLAPSATLLCVGTYTVTQADVDRGEVTHTVTASGLAPDGAAVTADPSAATTELAQAPALTAVNTAAVDDRDTNGRTDAGDVVRYRVNVTNAGTVTVTGVTATESLDTPGAPAVKLACGNQPLTPGAAVTCTGTHTVTDADAGVLVATATATGTTAAGGSVTSPPSTVATDVTAEVGAGGAPQPAGGHGQHGKQDGLARTGTAVGDLVVAGVGLLAVGLGLLLFNRRRSTRSARQE